MIKFTTPSFSDKRSIKPKPLFSVLRKNNRTATATDTTEEKQQTFNSMGQFMMDSAPSSVPLHPLATCSTAGTLQLPSSWETLPISPNHDPYTPPPNSVTLVDKPMKSTRHHHRHHQHQHHHNRYNTVRSTRRVDLQFLGDSQREDAFVARQAALDKLCGKTPPATVTDFTTDVTTIPSPPLSPIQQQTQPQHSAPTRQLTTSSSRRYHKKQQQQPHSPLLSPPEKYSYFSGNNNNSSSIGRQQTIRRKPTRRAPHHVPTGYFPSPPSPNYDSHFYHCHNSHHSNQQKQVGCLTPPSSSPRYLHRQHTQKDKLQPCSRSYRNTPLTPPFMQENTIRRKLTGIKNHEDDNLPLIHTVVTPTSQHTKLSRSEYFNGTATTTTSTSTIRSHDEENHNSLLNATLRQSFVSEFTDSETDSTGNTSEEERDDNEDRVVSITRHMRSIIVNEKNNHHNNNISARPSSPIMHQHRY